MRKQIFIMWQICCFIEFSKIVYFFNIDVYIWRTEYLESLRMLSVHGKDHLHSAVKTNFHLPYTFTLSVLFWARKTSDDTLVAFKVSITVHILMKRVLLYFSTFSEKLSCSKKYGYMSTSSFLCSKMSFPCPCSV